MLKVKIFWLYGGSDKTETMVVSEDEAKIQEFLEKEVDEIIHVTQSSRDDGVTVLTLFYKGK